MTAILTPQHQEKLFFKNGDTWDIVRVVFHADNRSNKDTKEFSKNFERSKAGLKKLWEYTRNEIKYKEDPDGKQLIQSPARLNHSEIGDCKSKTILNQSVLQNMKIEYFTRFVSYSQKHEEPTHVYTVAILDGEEIIIDSVYNKFNRESKPYFHRYDFHSSKIRTYEMTKVSYLHGIGNAATQTAIQNEIQNLKTFDFVNATEAERQEFLLKEHLYLDALWKKNQPLEAAKSLDAMTKVKVIRTAENSKVNGFIQDQFIKLKQRILTTVARVILPKMAAFFTYTVTDDNLLSDKAKAKKQRVERVVSVILNATGMSRATYNLIIVNGLKSKLNKLPADVVKSLYPNKVGEPLTIAAITAAVGAIGTLVTAISQIVKSFSRGDVSKDDAPSIDDFVGYGTPTNTNTNTNTNTQKPPTNNQKPLENNNRQPNGNNGNGESGNSTLLIIGALALLMLSK